MILEKIIKNLIYISLFLPLVFVNYSMYPWHFGKTIYFQILIEVVLVLAVFSFLFYKKEFKKFNLLDWLVLAFLGSQLISAIFGVNFNRSFWGDQSRASGVFTWINFTLFYFLLRQFFNTKKDWLTLGSIVIFVGFLSSIVAWVGQKTSIFSGIIEEGGRLMGFVGNPIFFANYLTIPIFLSFAWFFWYLSEGNLSGTEEYKSGWVSRFCKNQKWIYLGIGVFSLVTFLIAQVRGAFVGFLVGGFVVWLFFSFGKIFTKKIKKIVAVSGIIFIIAFLSLYALNQKSSLVEDSVPLLGRMLDISIRDTTAQTRLMAWEIAIKGWKDSPIIGYGPENYQNKFDKYYNPNFLKFSFAETVWDKPHNYFLEILGKQGVVGVSIYLLILAVILYYLKIVFLKQNDRNNKVVIALFFGAIFAYTVQGLFSFETSNSLQLWFLFLALVVFMYEKYREPTFVKVKNEILARAVAFVVIIGLLLSFYQNYLMLKSSYYMSLARDSTGILSSYYWKVYAQKAITEKSPFLWENAIFLTKELSTFDGEGKLNADMLYGVSENMESVFLRYIKKYPDSYLYKFWGSQLYAFMGEYLDSKYYIESEKLLKEAGEISKDRQNVPMLLSKNYLLRGENDKAIVTLENLVKKDTSYPEPHWFLGLAYIGNGEKEKGIKEMEKGISFGVTRQGNILYLIDLYLEDEDYKKAIPLYKKLIDMNPKDARFYHDLAVMYLVTGKQDLSIEYFNKTLSLDPSLRPGIEKFLKIKNVNINLLKN